MTNGALNLSQEEWGLVLNCSGGESQGVLQRLLDRMAKSGRETILFQCSARTAHAAAVGAARQSPPLRLCILDTDSSRLASLRFNLVEAVPHAAPLFFHGNPAQFRRDLQIAGGVIVSGAGEQPASADEPGPSLPGAVFTQVRERLNRKYFTLGEMSGQDYTPVTMETEPARAAVLERLRKRRRGWPRAAPGTSGIPPSLPGGRPWPRISVVTPSFNQGAYIEDTILSVLNQNYPDVEHIVIDGGSTDETSAVLERYSPRLAHSVSEKDRGQAHAINKGMALASGGILTWLNSDDMLAPGALHAAALAFATSGADMIAGLCSLYENGECVRHHLTSCEDGPLPLDDLLDLDGGWNAGAFFFQPEVLFSREIWERAGASVREDLHYSMDYDLWVRFAEAEAKLHVIGRPVAWFRIHKRQKTAAEEAFKAELEEYREAYFRKKPGRKRPSSTPPGGRGSLRFTFLNDLGFRYGAGIAHERLARTLQLAGHEVNAVILREDKANFAEAKADLDRVTSLVARQRPDGILLGNLHHAAADPLLALRLSEIAPTFAVLHDFWWLTGRCAYMGGCAKFERGCDAECPTAQEYPPLEPSAIAGAWEDKRTILNSKDGPVLLANSAWAASIVERVRAEARPSLPNLRCERIQLPIPSEHLVALDKRTSRTVLGLPADAFIVLVAGSLADPRKGLRDVFDAVAQLDLPDLAIAVIGNSQPNERFPGVNTFPLGYLKSAEHQAMAYSAADLFIGASREETFGQVYIESAACGTPAVGYDVSGVSEAILPGVTGNLSKERTPAALAKTVLDFYRHPSLAEAMGQWGRIYAENEWSPYRSYLSLFHAWRRTNCTARWQLARNISFAPAGVPRLRSCTRSNGTRTKSSRMN